MASRYNIYYAGGIREGHELSQVREKLQTLFKANEATLVKLFSGTTQTLKRDCDKATALKYKQAMERAGAVPVIKVVRAESSKQTPGDSAPEHQSGRKLTAAEPIAAVAAAPDVTIVATTPREPEPEVDEETGWHLEPAGTDLLRPEERAQPEVTDIDISALDTTQGGGPLSPPAAPAPPAPDTEHLKMGAAGETIPGLPSEQVPLDPDTDDLNLSPEGTDFKDCAPPPPKPPEVDLTQIQLAPEGSDVLAPEHRREQAHAAPSTSHISLQD